MTNRGLLEKLRAEEIKPFEGWDFSHLEGRMLEGPLPWSYESIVRKALPDATSLLDMGTGGGEFLISLEPFPQDTHATEGYTPNIPVARERLGRLGIPVHEIGDDDRLPLSDGTFDLVINRHESYDPEEVRRVLRPGGRFITQQVGGRSDTDLNALLAAPNPDFGMSHWDLEYARTELEEAGFEITEAAEGFPITRFTDVGAIVFYLKVTPWHIPDFTVNRYLARLEALERRIEDEGFVGVRSHRFLISARK